MTPSTYARPMIQPLQAGNYVPDGLTPAQYEARKKKEADKRKAKESFWSVKRTKPVEDLTSFQAERASKFSNKQISEGFGRKYFTLDLSFIILSGKPPATD